MDSQQQQNYSKINQSKTSQGGIINGVGDMLGSTLTFGKKVGGTTIDAASIVGKTTLNATMDIGKLGVQQTARLATGTFEIGKQITAQGYTFWEGSRKQGQSSLKSIGITSGNMSVEQSLRIEQQRPVPRIILSCCQVLAFQHALETPHILVGQVPFSQIEHLFKEFTQANGACLFPTAVNPQAVASLLKFYLSVQPEPLLTFKLMPEFISSIQDLSKARLAIKKLPKTNRISLDLILNLCNRIVQQQYINQVTPNDLAAALAPTMAWYPLPSQQDLSSMEKQNQTAKDNIQEVKDIKAIPLDRSDQKALEIVIEHLITQYQKDLLKD